MPLDGIHKRSELEKKCENRGTPHRGKREVDSFFVETVTDVIA